MKQSKAIVVSTSVLSKDKYCSSGRAISQISLLSLRCPEVARDVKPGQFITVRCGDNLLLPRPFSIHQVKDNDITLYFGVWEEGKGTNWLARRQAGEQIEVMGPLGNGFFMRPDVKNLLLVAGGIGIAPLVFLARQAVEKQYRVTLLAGTASGKQLYPKNLLPPQVNSIVATDDGSYGHKGRVSDLITGHIARADQVFACGPMPMYKAMAQMAELKDKPVQVSLEVVMGCGRGICYGCTVKTRRGFKEVCTDGPVFELNDVLWNELGL